MKTDIAEIDEVTEVIAKLLETIVDKADELDVDTIVGSSVTVIEVRPHKTDIGKLIGKKGVVASALRTILCAISGKFNHRFMLEIIEDE